MNRKGFTLIEVIMVIVVVSLLMILLVPNIFVLIEKNNEKSCSSLIKNIESAAKIYITNNKYDLGFGCSVDAKTKKITLKTLVDSGDLKLDSSRKIINPLDNEVLYDNTITDKVTVDVTYDCNTKTFTYVVSGFDCTK
jgi:competence protein ComGC